MARRVPQVDGSSYSDSIVWTWDRTRMQWSAALKDGYLIQVRLSRATGKRRASWTFGVLSAAGTPLRLHADSVHYNNPDAAQDAALEAVQAERKK